MKPDLTNYQITVALMRLVAIMLMLIVIATSCASIPLDQKVMFNTPCNPLSAVANESECYKWQENYPKEYRRWRLWIVKNSPEEMDVVILTHEMNNRRGYQYNAMIK